MCESDLCLKCGGSLCKHSTMTMEKGVLYVCPPAPDWLVPAAQIESLREICDEGNEHLPSDQDGCPCPGCECIRRARAVLDAATEVER